MADVVSYLERWAYLAAGVVLGLAGALSALWWIATQHGDRTNVR